MTEKDKASSPFALGRPTFINERGETEEIPAAVLEKMKRAERDAMNRYFEHMEKAGHPMPPNPRRLK